MGPSLLIVVVIDNLLSRHGFISIATLVLFVATKSEQAYSKSQENKSDILLYVVTLYQVS